MKEKIRKIGKESYDDFYQMYKIFERPPYCEMFSDEEIMQEYELLNRGGCVYGYYEEDVCVGMVSYNDSKFYAHPIHYEHSKAAYLSDVTVLEDYRGRGIGTKLMKFVVDKAKKENYEVMYMRTLKPGESMSYGIALKLGFLQLKQTEIIDRARHDESRNTVDERIFLELLLK